MSAHDAEILERAREAWRWAKRRDDETMRAARERRIMSAAGVRRARGGSMIVTGVMSLALLLAVITWSTQRTNVTAPSVLATSNANATSTASASARSLESEPSPSAKRTLVALRVVESRNARFAVGDLVPVGTQITLPKGAHLRLEWSIGESLTTGFDADGPTTFSIDANGTPTVVKPSPAASASASASGSANASAERDDDRALFREAEALLARGDRAAAEAALVSLLAGGRAHDPGLRARAELRLAELYLARRAVSEARALLEPLALGRRGALSSDAALLWARSFASPRDRADAWARYLATSPPSPMREHAMIERASCLADAGDASSARAIAAELHARPLPDVTAEALRRLESRLSPSTSP